MIKSSLFDPGLLDAIGRTLNESADSKWHFTYTDGDGTKDKQGPFDSKDAAHEARLKHFKDNQLDPDDVTKETHERWTDTTGESWTLNKSKK